MSNQISEGPMHCVVGPSLNLPINSIPDHQKIFYTRVLLSHLWSIYDLGGISMGRSFEAMLLELALELIGRDMGPIPKELSEPGDLINKIKDELSRTRLEALGLHRPCF